jgi:hypothetical protein
MEAEGHVEPHTADQADTPRQNCTGSDQDIWKLYWCFALVPVPEVFNLQNDKTRRGFPRRVLLVQFGLLAVGLTTRASDAA